MLQPMIDEDSYVKSTKRGLYTKQKPFEGYMRKLALDVNGVMGDAKYMLRDTGKLIHGLKRVVKGASILTGFTNNAVKYAKYFAMEPNNVTIDYLEEKAIIALLDAQKAANESKKAAKLARVASIKAIDTEKRIENSEGDSQDIKSIMPFVKATDILATKAEKAAKLAKLEKQKAEKDFVIMNRQLSRMSQKMNTNTSDQSETSEDKATNPDGTYFYMKQKQLEKDLLNSSKAMEETASFNTEIKSYSKELNDDQELKYIADLSKNITYLKKVQDAGKDAITTIAAELTNNYIPTQSLPPTSKIYHSTNNIAKKQSTSFLDEEDVDFDNESSDDEFERESHNQIKDQNNDSQKESISYAKETNVGDSEKESGDGDNSKPAKSFASVLKKSIENRDKLTSYISNKILPNSIQPVQPPSSSSTEDLTTNLKQEKKSDFISEIHKNIVMSEKTLPQEIPPLKASPSKISSATIKSSIAEIPKDDKNFFGRNKIGNEESKLLLNYLDMDISGSGDSSGDAENTTDNDESSTEGSTNDNKVPLDNPTDTSTMSINKFLIPKQIELSGKHKISKKEDIGRSYEFLDPFGFTKLEDSKEGYNTERDYIPIPEDYYNYKMRGRSDIQVPEYHLS